MRAVDGLRLDGGIPPRIEEHDVGRGREVEAEAAGLERDEEDGGAFRTLKFLHQFAAIVGLAGEIEVRPLARLHGLAHDLEQADELREDENLVAFLHEGFEQIDEGVELGAVGLAELLVHQRGVATDLAQTKERGEKVEAVLVQVLLGLHLEQELLGALELGAIKRPLFAFQFAEQIFLDAVGQIFRDLILRATQKERAHAGGEATSGERVVGGVELLRELRAVAEHARHGKGEDAPEIEQAILNGRAAEGEAMFGLQGAGGLRGLGVGVLDVLRLVENDGVPGQLRNLGAEAAQMRVMDDDEIAFDASLGERIGIFAAPESDAQAGEEALGFGTPVVHHALGADDERRLQATAGSERLFPQPGDPGEGLERFAEAHVVREHAAETVRREVGEEVEAFDLVRAKISADAGGHRRIDAGLQLAGATMDLLDLLLGQKFLRGNVGELEGVEPLWFGGEVARVEAEAGKILVLFVREIELQATPAFLAEAHVAALGVEENFQFFLGQLGVGDVEHDFEIEPIDAGFLDIELYAAGNGVVAEGGELAVEMDFDVRRQRGQPGDEGVGESLGEPDAPAVLAVAVPLGAYGLEELWEMMESAAIEDGDAFVGVSFWFLGGLVIRGHEPAVVTECLRRRALGHGFGADVNGILLAADVVRLEVAVEVDLVGDGPGAAGETRRQFDAESAQKGDAGGGLDGGCGNDQFTHMTQAVRRRPGIYRAGRDVEGGQAGKHQQDVGCGAAVGSDEAQHVVAFFALGGNDVHAEHSFRPLQWLAIARDDALGQHRETQDAIEHLRGFRRIVAEIVPRVVVEGFVNGAPERGGFRRELERAVLVLVHQLPRLSLLEIQEGLIGRVAPLDGHRLQVDGEPQIEQCGRGGRALFAMHRREQALPVGDFLSALPRLHLRLDDAEVGDAFHEVRHRQAATSQLPRAIEPQLVVVAGRPGPEIKFDPAVIAHTRRNETKIVGHEPVVGLPHFLEQRLHLEQERGFFRVGLASQRFRHAHDDRRRRHERRGSRFGGGLGLLLRLRTLRRRVDAQRGWWKIRRLFLKGEHGGVDVLALVTNGARAFAIPFATPVEQCDLVVHAAAHRRRITRARLIAPQLKHGVVFEIMRASSRRRAIKLAEVAFDRVRIQQGVSGSHCTNGVSLI